MKKLFICIFVLIALTGLSCKTAPSKTGGESTTGTSGSASSSSTTAGQHSGATIEGDVTQDKVNTALGQIYGTYRSRLDMTGAQNYTVVRGDTLSQITRKYYGSLTGVGDAGSNNGLYFPVLMMASTGSNIVDPDLIEPGMVLTVVDLKMNLANAASRQAIKDCLNEVAYVYNRKGNKANEDGLKRLANSL